MLACKKVVAVIFTNPEIKIKSDNMEKTKRRNIKYYHWAGKIYFSSRIFAFIIFSLTISLPIYKELIAQFLRKNRDNLPMDKL